MHPTAFRRWLVPAAAVSVLALDVHYHVWRNDGGIAQKVERLGTDLEPGEFPEAAAGYLAESGFAGRILNHAPWGGYLLYRLWPGSMVLADGRGNFGDLESRILEGMERPSARRGVLEEAAASVPFDAVVHPDPFPFRDNDLRTWVLAYHDPVAKVYLRPEKAGSVGPIEAAAEFQRSASRHWGERRLESGEKASEIAALSGPAAAGDTAAIEKLAAIYFELGLNERTVDLLDGLRAGSLVSPRAALLLAVAYRGDARPEKAEEICAALRDRQDLDRRMRYLMINVCREGR